MIYIKSNEYNIINNYNDKVKMILRSRLARDVTDITAIVDGWGRIGDHENTISVLKEQSSTTSDQELELEAESLVSSAPNHHFPTIAFQDLLCVETADPELCEMLLRPLSEALSPLTTPKEVR